MDGDPDAARALFQQAWDSHRDDYEASIAAHYLARHQTSPADSLYWNRVAVERAEAVPDGRAQLFLASLYLNLGDSYRALAETAQAIDAVERGIAALEFLPRDGYRSFVANGLQRLRARLSAGDPHEADT
ncbi:MAG TPA: hypothetical protein VFZ21_10630 [Gemmatimonadaceae bacterium]|nr:hypothetical protein [Gemmatimonadaceae bacterium]